MVAHTFIISTLGGRDKKSLGCIVSSRTSGVQSEPLSEKMKTITTEIP